MEHKDRKLNVRFSVLKNNFPSYLPAVDEFRFFLFSDINSVIFCTLQRHVFGDI